MIVNTNISSLNAQRNFGANNTNMGKTLEKLSSGLRINRAADDAAGLAISEKMRGQFRGLNQAVKNAQAGISLIQTAEGALNETHSILQRMRELAVQAATDTNTDDDRAKIELEVVELTKELNRIATTTEFNTMGLLSGGFTAKFFHIGANTGQAVRLDIADMRTGAIFMGAVTMLTQIDADTSIGVIDDAINTVSSERAKLGAMQNRLEHIISNLQVASENLTASESRIRDADMATEMSAFVKSQILSQAGVSMLAQANQVPQTVLKLLG
ncbi:MAG: flagellin [Peptococcaceae bacterium]|nr:flagellin [Peptococcaceae bacterium]